MKDSRFARSQQRTLEQLARTIVQQWASLSVALCGAWRLADFAAVSLAGRRPVLDRVALQYGLIHLWRERLQVAIWYRWSGDLERVANNRWLRLTAIAVTKCSFKCPLTKWAARRRLQYFRRWRSTSKTYLAFRHEVLVALARRRHQRLRAFGLDRGDA